MEPSSSIAIGGPLGGRWSADLVLAWVDAADDVHDAYAAWLRAQRAGRATAFTVYQAALDREEAAARALELHARELAASGSDQAELTRTGNRLGPLSHT
jgi:hypothetical protein